LRGGGQWLWVQSVDSCTGGNAPVSEQNGVSPDTCVGLRDSPAQCAWFPAGVDISVGHEEGSRAGSRGTLKGNR
jgi:hypothetical protein